MQMCIAARGRLRSASSCRWRHEYLKKTLLLVHHRGDLDTIRLQVFTSAPPLDAGAFSSERNALIAQFRPTVQRRAESMQRARSGCSAYSDPMQTPPTNPSWDAMESNRAVKEMRNNDALGRNADSLQKKRAAEQAVSSSHSIRESTVDLREG